jgi:integrase
MVLGAILRYAQRRELITTNPIEGVERHPVRYSGDYDIYSREEIDAIVRGAAAEQDAAIYLTAGLTGLRRGELLALRWRDIDFPGQAIRVRGKPLLRRGHDAEVGQGPRRAHGRRGRPAPSAPRHPTAADR